MDILLRIKRLMFSGNYVFTSKASEEMYFDDLDEADIVAAIVSATQIDKTLNSHDPATGAREKLYVIKGRNLSNVSIYTKGKIGKKDDRTVLYILISSKRSV